MKCKICGAKLKKEGDICKNCYEKKMKEKELEKDVKEVLKIRRKYLPAYEITRLTEIIVIFILATLSLLSLKYFLQAFLTLIILTVLIAVILLIEKRLAIGTKCTFYEKKLKYNFDFLFIHTERIIEYENIKDVSYYQNRKQKQYDLADLCVYVKYTGLIGGVNFKNLSNATENLEKIKQVVFKSEE